MSGNVFLTGNIMFEPVANMIKNLKPGMEESGRKIMDDIAGATLNEIKRTAPKKTGKYRKSWKIGTKTKKKIQIITDMGFLYLILEFQGSRPHKIRGNPILHFWIGDQEFFRREVNHPGFAAIPHVRPALDKIFARAAPEIMGKHLKVFG